MASAEVEKNFLHVKVNPANANLDIVAVHGLNPFSSDSNAYSTWTAEVKEQRRNWLTDDNIEGFLPKTLPTARVMIFGYNSNAVFEGSTATVNEHAENLLMFLRQERRRLKPPGRPILFICHSLGGLLAKRAIVMAHNMVLHKDTYESTKGFVFFATPHGGSDKVRVGNIAATIARTVLHIPDSRYLESLEKNSLCAETNRRDFLERTSDFAFISIIESHKTNGVEVVTKDDSVLNLPSHQERRIVSDTDHVQICKFWNPNGGTFKRIRGEIEEMAEVALASIENPGVGSVNADRPRNHPSLQSPEASNRFANGDLSTMALTRPVEGHDSKHCGTSQNPEHSMLIRRTSTARSEVDILVPGFSFSHVLNIMSFLGLGADQNSDTAPKELSQKEWLLPTFLRSFNHYDYRAVLEEVSETKDPHTCDWIFDTEEMKWWAESHNPPVQVLWFTGHPGIGKTTLASHIVEKLQMPQELEISPSSMVIYSFCHYQKNYTPSMVLSVAIHQILQDNPALQSFAFREDIQDCLGTSHNRIMKGKHRSSWTLWHLFNALVSHCGLDVVFFVVDAFNVLDEAAQRELAKLFRLRSQERNSKTELKLFITSLPGSHTTIIQSQWLAKCPDTLKHMEATQHEDMLNRDIENFISREKARIKRVQGYLKPELDLIDAHLVTYEHKSFLPVKLYFKQLEISSPKYVGEILLGVSRDLSIFYRNLVSYLPSELLSVRSALMTFVTYAFRPFDIQELAFACRWEEYGVAQTSPFAPERKNPLDADYIHRTKVEAERYLPMLKIRQGVASFFHDSIRDYILERAADRKDFLISRHEEAHGQLALLCIKTILYKSKLRVPESWTSGSFNPCLNPAEHVFLSYAMQFWLKHLQQAVPPQTSIENIDKQLLPAVKDMVQLWSSRSSAKGFREVMLAEFDITHDRGSPLQDLTPLEVLSALGLEPFLRPYVNLLTTDALRDMKHFAGNAIKLAIQGGHDGCFAILCESFGITSLEGDQYKTVITDSARSGRANILEKVLRLRGLRIHELVNALIAAFMNGNKKSLEELARDRSIFLDRNHFGMNALHAIFAYNFPGFNVDSSAKVINVCLAICRYLIENGISISSRDNSGYTALHWACRSTSFCERAVIEFLVSQGADVHDRSLPGLTPLHLAAYYCKNTDALACLLELGTNVLLGVASRGRMTPLHWAITRPNRTTNAYSETTFDIVEFLLRRGADIRAPNLRGITALEWGGQHRGAMLQAIYSGLQGVDIIAISHNPNTGVAILWAAWADVSPEALAHVVQALSEGRGEARRRQSSLRLQPPTSAVGPSPPNVQNTPSRPRKSFRKQLKRFQDFLLRSKKAV